LLKEKAISPKIISTAMSLISPPPILNLVARMISDIKATNPWVRFTSPSEMKKRDRDRARRLRLLMMWNRRSLRHMYMRIETVRITLKINPVSIPS
jgi:hypothetical protein